MPYTSNRNGFRSGEQGGHNSLLIILSWKLKIIWWYVEINCQIDATDEFFYFRSYCLLNMFWAPLCPSSGAREYYTSGFCLSYLVLGSHVVGVVWSWGLCVRFAGYYSLPRYFYKKRTKFFWWPVTSVRNKNAEVCRIFSSIVREKSWHKLSTPYKAPPLLSANANRLSCLALFLFTATIHILPQSGMSKQ
jgi:hypothetical protein